MILVKATPPDRIYAAGMHAETLLASGAKTVYKVEAVESRPGQGDKPSRVDLGLNDANAKAISLRNKTAETSAAKLIISVAGQRNSLHCRDHIGVGLQTRRA